MGRSERPKTRRIFGIAFVALALAVALVAGSGPAGSADAASTCVKHTRRVVQHVKRHGKRTRVVHLKQYVTCTEAAAPVVSTPIPAPVVPAPVTPAPAPAPAPTPEPEANAVSITTNDHTHPYGYVPSRTTVKAGRLTVQLNNMMSEDEHNMVMERLGEDGQPEGGPVAMLSAEHGEASKAQAVEVQPGTYEMFCTIGQHAEHGMKTTITVVE